MSIGREELESGRIGFPEDEFTPMELPPPHPGQILRREFMEPLDIGINALARALRLPPSRISDIVHGKRGITADTALRLERYFGVSASLWMGLQQDHDLRLGRLNLSPHILQTVQPRLVATECVK
ncbi:MAG: HigA family addiction module antitoxin [Rhodospirillaceae bacterium]